mgnify:CR=1 FL=1
MITRKTVCIVTVIVMVACASIGVPVLVAYEEDFVIAVNSLESHGRDTTYVCRWTDGKVALMHSSTGEVCILSIQCNFQNIAVGETYTAMPGLTCRWGRLPGQLRKV